MLVETQDGKSTKVTLQKGGFVFPLEISSSNIQKKTPEIKEELTNVPEHLGEWHITLAFY